MNDFSVGNELPTEVKQMIVNGQSLIDEVRERIKDYSLDLDLTSKAYLKNECKAIEKQIRKIVRSKGKLKEKDIQLLENQLIRLRTALDGIVGFFTRT